MQFYYYKWFSFNIGPIVLQCENHQQIPLLVTCTAFMGGLRMLKLKLMEELDDSVHNQVEFDVGYFSGKQSKKH